jgi:outer membrane protein
MKYNGLLDICVKVVLAIGIIASFVVQRQSDEQLVYVDSQRLVTGYKGAQAARQEFEAKSAVWKANLDSLRTEIEAKVTDYESKKAKLSTNEQRLTEEVLLSKQKEYFNYEQAIQNKIKGEDQALTQKVFGQVNEYLNKYGKKKGYKIILAATQYGNIVYAEEGLDVTNEVMQGLNAEYK